MIARLIPLLLLILPGAAEAGIKAVYVPRMGSAIKVTIADNGDFDLAFGGGMNLVQRGDALYVIEERLTGPIVDRFEDLAALARKDGKPSEPRAGEAALQSLGPVKVAGLSGEAFDYPRRAGEEAPGGPHLVLSSDPELRPLAAALRRLWEVQHLRFTIAHPGADHDLMADRGGTLRLMEGRTPLKFGDLELKTLERGGVRLEPFALASQAETPEALRLRLEAEARDDEPRENTDVSRAVFADGRLWVLTDDGKLTSLAQGERTRRPETPGAPVIDICSGSGGLKALTGERSRGRDWTLRRWERGRWTVDRRIDREDDLPAAFSCAGNRAVLLTDKRLIEVGRTSENALILSGDMRRPLVKAVVLEAGDHLFVGLNSGEWGGGLIRIDRHSGQVETIERNATGELCDGPLNTSCDPVHGIAPIPWKPSCVAAAVGLIHLMAHGRIAEICGKRVESLFVQPEVPEADDPETAKEVAAGGYGAVAFFGLAAEGDTLLAVGDNGLYRIGANGLIDYRRWPRFEEIGGLLVSFALPDAVLVVTTINGRASVGGAAPLLVMR